MSTILSQPPQYQMYPEIEKVILYWDTQIAEKPQDAMSFLERGKLWLIVRNYEKALSDFSQSLYLQPDNKEAEEYKKVIGELLVRDDEPVEAMEKLKRATNLAKIGNIWKVIAALMSFYSIYALFFHLDGRHFWSVIGLILILTSGIMVYYAEYQGKKVYQTLARYIQNHGDNPDINLMINDHFRVIKKYGIAGTFAFIIVAFLSGAYSIYQLFKIIAP